MKLFILSIVTSTVACMLCSCNENLQYIDKETKNRIKFEESMRDTSIHLKNEDRIPKNITKGIILHSDLKDCQVYEVHSVDDFYAPVLYITRCPDSHTSTTTSGKHSVTVESN